jgi:hypothetical protein
MDDSTDDVVADTAAMIIYGTAQNDLDLEQILALQRANLSTSIRSQQEQQEEGFVTLQHDLDLLRDMNAAPFPHIVAKHNNNVVGYALVLEPKSFEARLPLLASMLRRLRTIDVDGRPLTESIYFIMGQICVEKKYRSRHGIFAGLYRTMKERMAAQFHYVVTLVAERNPRSLRAHQKVGFRDVLRYRDETGEDWVVVLWDWRRNNDAS